MSSLFQRMGLSQDAAWQSRISQSPLFATGLQWISHLERRVAEATAPGEAEEMRNKLRRHWRDILSCICGAICLVLFVVIYTKFAPGWWAAM